MKNKALELHNFAQEYEKLEYSMLMQDGAADMDGWFYPELKKIVDRYEVELIVEYATRHHQYPLGCIEHLIKAGVTSFNKEYLLQFTLSEEELEVYDGAYFLALCGYDEGYEILSAFAKQTHPLYSGYISPITDMIEDLAYANDGRATKLVADIKEKYSECFK